jgi:Xaa-Pro aminopeptidase
LAPKGITVHPLPANPIDALWTVDGGRPAPPAGPLRVHPLAHAGKSVAEKLGDVRAALVKVHELPNVSHSLLF